MVLASVRAIDLPLGAVRIDALLLLRVPPGARAASLVARYDIDGAPGLSPAESRLLGDALADETIGGFYLSVAGEAWAPIDAEASARIEAGGRLAVAVLLTYAAMPLANDRADDSADDLLVVSLATREARELEAWRRGGALTASIDALPPLTLRGVGVSAGPVSLAPGEPPLEVLVTAAAPAASAP